MRIVLVAEKNLPSEIFSVPWKKNTPTATATPSPRIVPIQTARPSVESSTARKISASSAPSRTTMRKTKVARPIPAENSDFAACLSTRFSISVFRCRATRFIQMIMVTTKTAATRSSNPFESVFADLPALQRDGNGQAGSNRGEDASPHPAREIRAPGAVQIDEHDADDQGGFDTFTKSDEESREQKAILQRAVAVRSRFTSHRCRVKAQACTQNGARKGTPSSCNSFATGNTSVHGPSTPGQVYKFLPPGASPDGRICIYMILAMIQPRCHLANRSRTDRWFLVARRFAAVAFAGLLIVAPVLPQSSGAASHAAAPAQAKPASTPRPQPDKGRARERVPGRAPRGTIRRLESGVRRLHRSGHVRSVQPGICHAEGTRPVSSHSIARR